MKLYTINSVFPGKYSNYYFYRRWYFRELNDILHRSYRLMQIKYFNDCVRSEYYIDGVKQ